MIFTNQMKNEGKITIRPPQADRGDHPERCMHKDKTLAQAEICLTCDKKTCSGTDACKRKREMGEHNAVHDA